MIGFEVYKNKKKLVTAGGKNLGSLSAIITATGFLGPETQWARETKQSRITLHVGGATVKRRRKDDTLENWISQSALKVGDAIQVVIVDTKRCAVAKRSRLMYSENDERQRYEYCKKGYFELKVKYEPKEAMKAKETKARKPATKTKRSKGVKLSKR